MKACFVYKGSCTFKNEYVVYRAFSLAVGRLKKKKKKEKMEKIRGLADFRIAMFSSYFVSVSRYRST